MFSGGYYTLGRFKGAPIRVHWTAPLGAFVFSGFRFAPAFWAGLFFIILIHEVGHAIVVRACGMRVTGIEVQAIGGQCRYDGYPSQMRLALVAWGGVWAQLALLAIVELVLLFVHVPPNRYAWELIDAFTRVNVWIMALNLIPFRPLDGAEAWKLFPLLYERWKVRRHIRISAAPMPRPVPKKSEAKKPSPKYSERVSDPKQSEELFNRLMGNNPVEEEGKER